MRVAERKKFHLRQFSAIWVILRSCRIYLAQFWLSRRRRRRRRRRRHRVGQVHVAVDQCHQSCLVAKNISVFFSPLSLGGHLFFPFPSSNSSEFPCTCADTSFIGTNTDIYMYVRISRTTDYAVRIHMCIARSRRRERESEREREWESARKLWGKTLGRGEKKWKKNHNRGEKLRS